MLGAKGWSRARACRRTGGTRRTALPSNPDKAGVMWGAFSGTHDLPRPKMWRARDPDTYRGGVGISRRRRPDVVAGARPPGGRGHPRARRCAQPRWIANGVCLRVRPWGVQEHRRRRDLEHEERGDRWPAAVHVASDAVSEGPAVPGCCPAKRERKNRRRRGRRALRL